ncbi:MAG: hypothetical protein K2Y21_07515 [Phycisphaerales bacterium]|nr:hypothetical protein [Phycisphaerales bacterium]
MQKNRVRVARSLVAAVLVCAPLALAACNTVSGVGKDIEETSDNTKKVFTPKSSSSAQPKTGSSNDTTQVRK